MGKDTKIKAKIKKNVGNVKALMKHEMLSYQEAQRAKKEVNFIVYVKATVNGETVYEVSTSQFLSKNPYLKFSFDATGFKKGDEIEIFWRDLKGDTNTSSTKLK